MEHNSHIDFSSNTLSFVSNHCLTYCVTLPTNVSEFPKVSSAFSVIQNNYSCKTSRCNNIHNNNCQNNSFNNNLSSGNNSNSENSLVYTSFLIITYESKYNENSNSISINPLIVDSFSVSSSVKPNLTIGTFLLFYLQYKISNQLSYGK